MTKVSQRRTCGCCVLHLLDQTLHNSNHFRSILPHFFFILVGGGRRSLLLLRRSIVISMLHFCVSICIIRARGSGGCFGDEHHRESSIQNLVLIPLVSILLLILILSLIPLN